MKHFCRTTTNCRLNPNNTSNDGSGNATEDASCTSSGSGVGVVAEVETEMKNGGNDSLIKDQKTSIREISDTPKPPARLSKKRKEAEHLQSQMVHMLNQEGDEIDLVFQAMSKRIWTNLSDEETEDLMQELSDTVTKQVRLAQKKELESPKMLQPQPQP